MSRRVNLRAILSDPAKRRELFVETIIATQAREGITTTREQAEAAYDAIQRTKRFGMFRPGATMVLRKRPRTPRK